MVEHQSETGEAAGGKAALPRKGVKAEAEDQTADNIVDKIKHQVLDPLGVHGYSPISQRIHPYSNISRNGAIDPMYKIPKEKRKKKKITA